MKENIKLFTPKIKNNIEMIPFYEGLRNNILTVIFIDILILTSLIHSDYPQSFDYQSIQFYLGVFYMVIMSQKGFSITYLFCWRGQKTQNISVGLDLSGFCKIILIIRVLCIESNAYSSQNDVRD